MQNKSVFVSNSSYFIHLRLLRTQRNHNKFSNYDRFRTMTNTNKLKKKVVLWHNSAQGNGAKMHGVSQIHVYTKLLPFFCNLSWMKLTCNDVQTYLFLFKIQDLMTRLIFPAQFAHLSLSLPQANINWVISSVLS